MGIYDRGKYDYSGTLSYSRHAPHLAWPWNRASREIQPHITNFQSFVVASNQISLICRSINTKKKIYLAPSPEYKQTRPSHKTRKALHGIPTVNFKLMINRPGRGLGLSVPGTVERRRCVISCDGYIFFSLFFFVEESSCIVGWKVGVYTHGSECVYSVWCLNSFFVCFLFG